MEEFFYIVDGYYCEKALCEHQEAHNACFKNAQYVHFADLNVQHSMTTGDTYSIYMLSSSFSSKH